MTTTKEPTKYRFIDCLRGHAILGVVMIHTQALVSPIADPSTEPTTLEFLITKLASSGARGVQLFFLVSALTLALSMQSRIRSDEQSLWKSFFIRRFMRIAPLFYVVLAYHAVFGYHAPWTLEASDNNWFNIAAGALFINGWFPRALSVVPGGWSIAVEMTFYLVFPLIWLKIRTVKTAVWCTLIFYGLSILIKEAVTALYPMIDPTVSESQLGVFVNLFFLRQGFCFLLGHVLFLQLKDYFAAKEFSDLQQQAHRRNGQLLLSLGVGLYLLMTYVSGETFLYVLSLAMWVRGLALYPWRVAVNPLFAFIGRISFSIYLLHFMVISALYSVRNDHLSAIPQGPAGFLIAFAVVLSISCLLSWMTFHLIEQPGIAAGKWIIARLGSSKVPPRLSRQRP